MRESPPMLGSWLQQGPETPKTANLVVRLGLLALAVYFGAIVVYRAALALPGIGRPVLPPLHAEDWLALAVTLSFLVTSVAIRSERTVTSGNSHSRWSSVWPLALIAILTFLAFWRALTYPLLSDDYIIVRYQQDWSWSGLAQLFRTPGGDGFFRPIGNLTLAATAHWAGPGNRPELWRLVAFTIHCLNAILVYVSALQLKLSRTSAIAAACLFAVHAVHPEAVVWIAARFDLVSTFFVLLAVVLFQSALQSKHFSLLAGLATVSMVLGALSKESGYIFPLLATIVAVHAGQKSKRVILALAVFYGGAAALFAYRWSLFGGVGGYTDASGKPQALHFSLAPAAKTLFLRLWTALYFPINWSVQPGVLLVLLLALYIGAMLWLMLGRPLRRDIWLGIGLVLATTLVPLHLLILDKDLQGSRMIYLASAAFSILLGVALNGLRARARPVCALLIILFNWAALNHNLDIWQMVSHTAQLACNDASPCAGGSVTRMLVWQLPESIDGVYFFQNGFPQCLEAASGRKIEVELNRGSVPPSSNDQLGLRWNQQQKRLECSGDGGR
jgi:hypothetical protein